MAGASAVAAAGARHLTGDRPAPRRGPLRPVPRQVHHDGGVTDLLPPDDLTGADTDAPAASNDATPPVSGSARRRRWKRVALIAVPVVLALAAVVAAATVPVDYVIETPGPTWNVLGNVDGEQSASDGGAQTGTPVISVTGADTYPADGALRMTTVSVRGCPGYPVTFLDVLGAWLDDEATVLDRALVCPETMSAQQVEEANQAQMDSSQSAAVAAALVETGLASSITLEVHSVSEAQAQADLVAGDVLTAITVDGERTELVGYAQLREILSRTAPGTHVTLTVDRAGTLTDVEITTLSPQQAGASEDTEGSLLGLRLSMRVNSDVDAQFGLDSVGGPSAGSMFALGIVDALTPGSLTGGQDIAGTGTIDVDGRIGAIGGIRQKMLGAAHAGSTWFLAPADNCDEVVGHEPEGMTVVSVSTLHEAVEAVEAIASGQTGSLPSCQAAG